MNELDPRIQVLIDEGVLAVVPRAGADLRFGEVCITNNMTGMERPARTAPLFYAPGA